MAKKMTHKEHANLCADNLARQLKLMATKKWTEPLGYAQRVALREACSLFLAKSEVKKESEYQKALRTGVKPDIWPPIMMTGEELQHFRENFT